MLQTNQKNRSGWCVFERRGSSDEHVAKLCLRHSVPRDLLLKCRSTRMMLITFYSSSEDPKFGVLQAPKRDTDTGARTEFETASLFGSLLI